MSSSRLINECIFIITVTNTSKHKVAGSVDVNVKNSLITRNYKRHRKISFFFVEHKTNTQKNF